MLNEEIIPITYFAGSGGNFLCHLLVSAKLNRHDALPISITGNVHRGLKDLSLRYNWKNKDEKFIVNELASTSFLRTDKPFFIPLHLTNINLINNHFAKSIRITFELDDVEEIATIFYKKFYLTDNNVNKTLQDIILNTKISCNDFKNINKPNVLFISWKEYFRGDIENLILKLSSYTNINADNFSREYLTIWREATLKCLENSV